MSGEESMKSIQEAVAYAIVLKVDIINISAGGKEFSLAESAIIKKALDSKITVVAAAGNNFVNLDKECNFFPACYDERIIVVGNLNKDKSIADTSNYGNYVKKWEVGQNVLSDAPNGGEQYKSGTSQAAAIVTGKIVKTLKK